MNGETPPVENQDSWYSQFVAYGRGMQDRFGDAAAQITTRRYSHGEQYILQPGLYNARERVRLSPPDCVIAIPVAMMAEKYEDVLKTVDEVITGADGLENIDIIFDLNTKMTPRGNRRTAEADRAEAAMRADELGELLADNFPKDSRFFVTHHFMPDAADMNYVRFHQIDGAAHHVVWWNYPFDTPVVLVDADQERIERGVISQLVKARWNSEARIVKPMMFFGPHLDDDRPLWERTDSEQASYVYCFAKRRVEETLDPYDLRIYPDENMMCFSIGDWVRLGGAVDPRRLGRGFRGEGKVLLEAVSTLEPKIPPIKYLPDARCWTSDRRFVDMADHGIIANMALKEDDAYYVPYTLSMEGHNRYPLRTWPIRQSDVNLMLGSLIARHRSLHPERRLSPEVVREIGQLVAQCTFVPDREFNLT